VIFILHVSVLQQVDMKLCGRLPGLVGKPMTLTLHGSGPQKLEMKLLGPVGGAEEVHFARFGASSAWNEAL